MRFDVILGEALRRAACPHAADCYEFSAFDEIQPLRHGFAVPPPQIRGDIRAAFSHKKTRAIIRTAM